MMSLHCLVGGVHQYISRVHERTCHPVATTKARVGENFEPAQLVNGTIHPLLRTGGLLRSARYCILCLCDIRKEFDSTGFQEHAVQFYMMEGDLESRYHKQKTDPFTHAHPSHH